MSTAGTPVAAVVLLAAGVLVTVAAALVAVLLRTRMHLVTVVTSVGGPLVGAALVVDCGGASVIGQVVLVVVLLALTGAVQGAATGRMLHRHDEREGS